MVSKVAKGISEEAISKTFTSLVLKGEIRMMVRFMTLRGAGGILSPDVTSPKSGQLVIDVLREKHLTSIVPDIKVLEHYDVVPEFAPLDVTEDTVETISG